MFDYSFFAMLFLVAQALAPAGAARVALENERHPEQRMEWTRDGDRWAMTINGRPLGHFRRVGEHVVHETGTRDPDRFEVAQLVDARDLTAGAPRVRLRGRFAPAVLVVARADGAVRLVDRSRDVLRVPLRVR